MTPDALTAWLAKVEQRASRATAGPWGASVMTSPQWYVTHGEYWAKVVCVSSQGNDEPNMVFIAAAREDVPRLLAMVRVLVTEMEVLTRLGNGDRPGNSIGNRLAQDALAECERLAGGGK